MEADLWKSCQVLFHCSSTPNTDVKRPMRLCPDKPETAIEIQEKVNQIRSAFHTNRHICLVIFVFHLT